MDLSPRFRPRSLYVRWRGLDWKTRCIYCIGIIISLAIAPHAGGFFLALYRHPSHWIALLLNWQSFDAGVLQVGAAAIAVLAVFRQIESSRDLVSQQIASTEALENRRLKREITAQRLLLTLQEPQLRDYAKQCAADLASKAWSQRQSGTAMRFRPEFRHLPMASVDTLRSLIALGGTKAGDRLLDILIELSNSEMSFKHIAETVENLPPDAATELMVLQAVRFLRIHAQCDLLQAYLLMADKGGDFIPHLLREQLENSAQACIHNTHHRTAVLEHIQARPYPLTAEQHNELVRCRKRRGPSAPHP